MKASTDVLERLGAILTSIKDAAADVNVKGVLDIMGLVPSLYELVASSVTGISKERMSQDIEKVLAAFHEARRKAESAATNTLGHRTAAIIELQRLRSVIRVTRIPNHNHQLKNNVEPENINLPKSDLEDLEQAEKAFLQVQDLAAKFIQEDGPSSEKKIRTVLKVVLMAAIVCLIVGLIVALAVALGPGGAFPGVKGAVAVAILGLGTLEATINLLQKHHKLKEIVKKISKKRQELVKEAGDTASGIIKDLRKVQEELKRISNRAKNIHNLADLKDEKFEDLINAQLQDMEGLGVACRALINSVNEAYSSLKDKAADIDLSQRRR